MTTTVKATTTISPRLGLAVLLAFWQCASLSLGATSSSATLSHRDCDILLKAKPEVLRLSAHHPAIWKITRGGSLQLQADDGEEEQELNDDDNNEGKKDLTKHPEFGALKNYWMKQQVLMQLRATFLSEALAKRGIPLPTLEQVATPEGASPPQIVDWDCALATEDDPKSCLYSFDAEPNTKVVAPLGTTQWISLGALNRLRRTDPTKVEPMWHSQFAILDSWFDPESEYSLLQHVGIQGFFLNALLHGIRLRIALTIVLSIGAIICMPAIEYMVNRFLVSGFLWMRWHQWSRFVHAALPLKLLLGQMGGQFIARLFDKLLNIVKDRLVELECQILEQRIPLTVGVPTIDPESDAAVEMEEEDEDAYDDEDLEWSEDVDE